MTPPLSRGPRIDATFAARRRRVLLTLLRALPLTGSALAACSERGPSDGNGTDMFGLFGSRKAAAVSHVNEALQAGLIRHPDLPTDLVEAPAAHFGRVASVLLQGQPPAATLQSAAEGSDGRQFLVSGIPGQPSLLVATIVTDLPRVEIWELGTGQPPPFVHRRAVTLDPAAGTKLTAGVFGVAVLPDARLLLAVRRFDLGAVDRLYLHDLKDSQTRQIAAIEPDPAFPALDHLIETLVLSPDAVLVIYYTDRIALKGERFANRFTHGLLYSTRHPDGLELFTLAIDDGAIRRWSCTHRVLWLETRDERDPAQVHHFVWSLDLGAVL